MAPVRVLGYPVETVIAEKIVTAIDLREVSTRVRDWADLYLLSGSHRVECDTLRAALLATADYRGSALWPLSGCLGEFATLRSSAYLAYRAGLGDVSARLSSTLPDGSHRLPRSPTRCSTARCRAQSGIRVDGVWVSDGD